MELFSCNGVQVFHLQKHNLLRLCIVSHSTNIDGALCLVLCRGLIATAFNFVPPEAATVIIKKHETASAQVLTLSLPQLVEKAAGSLPRAARL